MKLPILLVTAAAIATPAPEISVPATVARPAAPQVRLPGFAAELAQQPAVSTPSAWAVISDETAWRLLARATQFRRQQARWDYARSLIGRGRAAEAHGVLGVMRQDDPDLAMVDAFRLAHGVALALMARREDALAELSGGGLVGNAEACAWRLRILADSGFPEQAFDEIACAQSALNARSASARAPFVIAAARAAMETGKAELTIKWLGQLPDRNAAANLYRGRAYLALGKPAEARLRLARVERSGSMAERMDARLSTIEADVANGALKAGLALKRLDALRFAWRGDHVEERALRMSYRLSVETSDLRGALGAGATLFRFFDPGRQGPDFVAGLQVQLGAALDPANRMPIEQAAGLFWDYRDLAPSGAEGDFLVSKLGERLQAAGLYARAAELFEHQLFVRARDLAQGPLSVRVATLHILSGQPDRALAALRKTVGNTYPDEVIFARKRVEAVALTQSGKAPEAFAVLQDVPDGAKLRAEILWKKRDWEGLAGEMTGQLPTPGRLSDVDQAVVLRHAISLAMLGREESLITLRARYASAFAGLPTAAVFDMLTATVGTVDPAAIARAMAAMPTASPAGEMAELFDIDPIAAKRAGG